MLKSVADWKLGKIFSVHQLLFRTISMATAQLDDFLELIETDLQKDHPFIPPAICSKDFLDIAQV